MIPKARTRQSGELEPNRLVFFFSFAGVGRVVDLSRSHPSPVHTHAHQTYHTTLVDRRDGWWSRTPQAWTEALVWAAPPTTQGRR